MKFPSLFLVISASMAIAQSAASYTFSQRAAEPQPQTFELLRTSYISPATPVVVLPTPTAAGSPAILTPTVAATTPPSTGSSTGSECPMMCTAMYKPVCGSNGKTYSNACELSVAQCRSPAAKIAMVTEGECEEGASEPATPATSLPEPTTAAPTVPATPAPSQPAESPVPATTTTAPSPAATTTAPTPATTTTTTPKCPQMCTSDFTPLCGSDGKTYSNACEFAVAQCQNPQTPITKAADGECGAGASTTPEPEPQTPAPASGTSAPASTTSAPTPAASSSKCTQVCSSDFTPLCGSDGKTYSNACALAVARCENPTANLVKASDGECGGSGSSGATPAPSTPGAGVTLAPPASGSPATKAPKPSESKCEMACTKMFAPVCGSNGMTYNNVCELRLANCKSGSSAKVTIASQGACGAATVQPMSTGSSTTTATSTTSTTTTTSTGGGKDGYLRGSGNSPFQGQ